MGLQWHDVTALRRSAAERANLPRPARWPGRLNRFAANASNASYCRVEDVVLSSTALTESEGEYRSKVGVAVFVGRLRNVVGSDKGSELLCADAVRVGLLPDREGGPGPAVISDDGRQTADSNRRNSFVGGSATDMLATSDARELVR